LECENGARTDRRQIDELGLQEEVLRIPRKSPMKNYIYFPDHLVELPSAGTTLLGLIRKLRTEPLFRGLLSALWSGWAHSKAADIELAPTEVKKIRQAPRTVFHYLDPQARERDDQSVGEYYSKYTSQPEVVNNVLSAMVHGIWGGDVSRLSSRRDPLGNLVDRPALSPDLSDHALLFPDEIDLPLQMTRTKKASYNPAWTTDALKHGQLCFKNGFSTLTKALVEALEGNPMVTIRTNEPITALHKHTTGLPVVVSKGQGPRVFQKVISTINADTLASITRGKLPSLADSHAVTIQAVNLWYPTPNLNAPYHGFGYLIPKTIKHEHNPECALGVLFDSDREMIAGHSPDTVQGTKFTVLLGGHYWDELPPNFRPSQAKAIEMAKAVVARHLGIPKHENDRAVASTKLCQGCIPQHYVGHWSRMVQADIELKNAFGGKVAVAGPSYQAPGVMGSIRAARELAWYTAGFYADFSVRYPFAVGEAGLDRFSLKGQQFTVCHKAVLPMRFASHHLQSRKPSLFENFQANFIVPALQGFLKLGRKFTRRWHYSDSWNIRLGLDMVEKILGNNVRFKREMAGQVKQPWGAHDEETAAFAELQHKFKMALKRMEELERLEDTKEVAKAKRGLGLELRIDKYVIMRRLGGMRKEKHLYYASHLDHHVSDSPSKGRH
jgi:protoporphyrinogen/coproporphyrinogen III oxidase